jgi:hypothetical protein
VRIRSLIYIIFICFLIGGFSYFRDNFLRSNNITEVNVIAKAALELTPMPVLSSSNSSQKNTLLYDMLSHKSGQDVLLQDVSVELGGLKKFFPIELEKLILKITYSADKERLEFSGESILGSQVLGHCFFDDKNNMEYHIELAHSTNKIFIKLKHDPNDDRVSAYSFGEFSWEAPLDYVIKLVSNTEVMGIDTNLSLHGKFLLKNDNLVLSDFIFAGKPIEGSVVLRDISKKRPELLIKTINNSINLDLLTNLLRDPILVQELIRNLSSIDIDLAIKADNAYLRNVRLKNLKLDLHNKEGAVDIRSLYFEFPNGGSFFSKGAVHDHELAPQYIGELQIKKVMSKDMHNFVFEEKVNSNSRVDISTKIRLKPSLLIMDGVRIAENDFVLRSKFLKSMHFNDSNSFLIGDLMLNKPIEHSSFLSGLLKKYTDKYQDEGELKSSVDLDLVLSSGVPEKNISMNYMMTPSFIRVTNMVVDKGLNGNIEIDMRKKTLNGNLSGEIREWQSLMRGVVSVTNIGFFNGISNNFNGFKGAVVINAKNTDKNFSGDLKCQINYKGESKVQLSDCYINTLGGRVDFVGAAFMQGLNAKYDIDYSGNGLSLQSLVSSGLIGTSSISVKDARGDFSVHGHLNSFGADMLEILKNMVSRSELEFREASIGGNLFKKSDKNASVVPLKLSVGRIESKEDSIFGEFSGVKGVKEQPLLKFSYDLIKKVVTTTIL